MVSRSRTLSVSVRDPKVPCGGSLRDPFRPAIGQVDFRGWPVNRPTISAEWLQNESDVESAPPA